MVVPLGVLVFKMSTLLFYFFWMKPGRYPLGIMRKHFKTTILWFSMHGKTHGPGLYLPLRKYNLQVLLPIRWYCNSAYCVGGDACSKSPITIRSHDSHATSQHYRGCGWNNFLPREGLTLFFLWFLRDVRLLTFFGLHFCLPCDGSYHLFWLDFLLPPFVRPKF